MIQKMKLMEDLQKCSVIVFASRLAYFKTEKRAITPPNSQY